MKKLLSFVFFVFSFLLSAYSQSSEKISDIVNEEKITFGQLSYLIGTCNSWIEDSCSYDEAFSVLKEKKFFQNDKRSDEPARLDEISHAITKALKIKGGLLYRITDSKRYAFKELKAMDIISQNSDPSSKISGRDAIGILYTLISEEK